MVQGKQLENIVKQEAVLNKLTAFLVKAEQLLNEWKALQVEVAGLDAYYQSEQWKIDYKASEDGEIPLEVPHGIVSEDAIYNALTDKRELEKEYVSFLMNNQRK